MAYDLDFPTDLESTHPTFHISLLKKYICDATLVMSIESLGMQDRLYYEEVPIEIINHQVLKLRNKEVSLVKVLRMNQLVQATIWKAKVDMLTKYLHLLPLDLILA